MKICNLCGSSKDDELNLGEFLTREDITVHYFCLLFAPLLTTKGEDEEGIRGFLLEDIRQECKRVKQIRCQFCLKLKASLGCCNANCPRAYHLGCGVKNRVTFEFCGHYESYCDKHSSSKQKGNPKKNDTCGICQETMKKTSRLILVPCCKGSWFHHDCLQRAASTAGVFAKCPLCNNKDEFRSSLQKMGVFFPQKDADWELDRTIFNGLAQSPPMLCEKCQNSSDLNYSAAPWLWKICCVCGAGAIHVSCFAEKENEDFTCNGCETILSKPRVPETSFNSTKKKENSSLKESTSQALEVKTKKSKTSLEKIETVKSSPKTGKKFTPWFSDDEQLDESDSDDCFYTEKRSRIDKT